MNLSKENTKKILLIAAVIIFMLAVALNFRAVYTVVGNFLSVFNPALIGLCIAFVLNILVSVFEDKVFAFLKKEGRRTHKKRPGLCRGLSIVSALIVVLTFIALILLVIVPQVITTATAIADGFPAFTDRAVAFTGDMLTRFNITPERVTEITLGGEDILTSVGDFVKNNIVSVLSSARTVGGNILSLLANLLIGFIIAIYLLFEKDTILAQIRRTSNALMSKKLYNSLSSIFSLSQSAFAGFISGQFIEACILGSLCFVGMLIFKFPYAAVVAVLVGVSALIPILGAWLGGGISAILILINSPIKALWFIIFLLVLQQIEGNLIFPHVVGSKVGLPGIWVLLAVVIGTGLYGGIGALLAVPVTSVLYTLAARIVGYAEKKKAEKTD